MDSVFYGANSKPLDKGNGGFSPTERIQNPLARGMGDFSSTKVCKNPLSRRIRLTFSFPKRKSYKKKLASLQLDRNGKPRLFALPKRHPQHTRKVQVQGGASEGFRQPLWGIFSRFMGVRSFGFGFLRSESKTFCKGGNG